MRLEAVALRKYFSLIPGEKVRQDGTYALIVRFPDFYRNHPRYGALSVPGAICFFFRRDGR